MIINIFDQKKINTMQSTGKTNNFKYMAHRLNQKLLDILTTFEWKILRIFGPNRNIWEEGSIRTNQGNLYGETNTVSLQELDHSYKSKGVFDLTNNTR